METHAVEIAENRAACDTCYTGFEDSRLVATHKDWNYNVNHVERR